MTRWKSSARRWPRRAARCIAVAFASVGASAQSTADPTGLIGFSAGPFVIAPSLSTSFAYDSNVFYQSESSEPSGDEVLIVQPAVLLTLPFSNSVFRLGDTLKWTDYQKTAQTAGKTANDAIAQLILNFGTSDTLELSAHNIAGVAETLAFDPGGASTFQGHAYDLHNELVVLKRDDSTARGYRVSLQRNALHFDPDQNIDDFYNSRGFDGEAAYLEPLSSNARLAVGYLGSRYDHYKTVDPYVIARTESGDTIYAQLEGRLGPRQPFSLRLGWERLAFTLSDFKDFSGIVANLNLNANVGSGMVLTVRAQRQPFRSFFEGTDYLGNLYSNNFYVFELIGAKIARRFPQGTEFGLNLDVFRNTYDEPIPLPQLDPPPAPAVPTPFVYRRDRARRLEAYASLALWERVAVRFEIAKNWRHSNFVGADYDALEVSGGFVFGWN